MYCNLIHKTEINTKVERGEKGREICLKRKKMKSNLLDELMDIFFSLEWLVNRTDADGCWKSNVELHNQREKRKVDQCIRQETGVNMKILDQIK